MIYFVLQCAYKTYFKGSIIHVMTFVIECMSASYNPAERNVSGMTAFFRKTLLLVVIVALMLLISGCGASAHIKAITEAVVTYSDYYIEVRNLGDQVRAQSETAETTAGGAGYTIFVDIPDYAHIDPGQTDFVLPEPDFSLRSANAYQKQVSLALRQAMEQYAMQNGADGYIQLPVTFTLSASDRGWTAHMASQSKLDIQKTVEDLIFEALQTIDAYREGYRRMQVSSALPNLLSASFGGEKYAQKIEITDVIPLKDGTYTVKIFYPDADFVFSALGDAYIASFNQQFYGSERTADLTTEGLKDIRLEGAPQQAASVLVSFDEAANSIALLDDGGLSARIADAKAQVEASVSALVNAQWLVTPLALPDNASVLEGQSRGNQIVFKAGASLGKYFYVRFYQISGEDASEEGMLQLGVFIIGGKSARVKLPTGYYRVICVAGESWYGIEHLFGSDMKTYNGGNAIRSRSGYINNISFE